MGIKRIKRTSRLVLTVFVLIFGIVMSTITSYADDASFYFGSQEYYQSRGQKFPVGFYMDLSSGKVGKYHIELEYDPYRMKYVSGADRVEDNLLIFEGDSCTGNQKFWLVFEAISGGEAHLELKEVDIEVYDSATGEKCNIPKYPAVKVHISGEDTAAEAEEQDRLKKEQEEQEQKEKEEQEQKAKEEQERKEKEEQERIAREEQEKKEQEEKERLEAEEKERVKQEIAEQERLLKEEQEQKAHQKKIVTTAVAAAIAVVVLIVIILILKKSKSKKKSSYEEEVDVAEEIIKKEAPKPETISKEKSEITRESEVKKDIDTEKKDAKSDEKTESIKEEVKKETKPEVSNAEETEEDSEENSGGIKLINFDSYKND